MDAPKHLTYKEKLDQATREAKATVVAVAAIVVVWILLGFGLAGSDITLFHTPIWVIGGTVGVWLFTVAVCVFLVKKVFMDFDLDEEEAENER